MKPAAPTPARVLVLDPDPDRAAELAEVVRASAAEARIVGDAAEAWRAFARVRPTHVVAALGDGDTGGAWLLRRIRGEYLGPMPEIYLTCAPAELAQPIPCEPDALLVTPVARAHLTALLRAPRAADTPQRHTTRLRELFDVGLLGPDLIQELDAVIARAALAFQVADCLAWGPAGEPYWPRSTRARSDEDERALLARARMALAAGGTVLTSAGEDGRVESLLAAPLGPPGEPPAAGLCLVADGTRRFAEGERDALRVLARRLSRELAWMAAHDRLIVEHETLRRSALLDPLLGVWTRPALERAVDDQLETSARRGVPLALAVLDYQQLRAVNDRHGHVVGDAVLAHFARTVSAAIRPHDQVGRFGGDELAVLFVDAELDEARRLSEEVIAALARSPYRDGELELAMPVHGGLTPLEPDEVGGAPGFARALTAMARARRRRRPLEVSDPGDVGAVLGAPAPLPAGSTLGGMYRVLHEISHGAMGVVYRGEDLGLGRPVALKVLRSDLASDHDLVARFRAEAALLASLRHRNLVQVHAFGSEGDDVFFVMELVEGEPLSTIARRLTGAGERIEREAASAIAREIADALDALHEVGIVHRDVKPDNVLLDRIHRRAVLVDVGIARRPGDAREAAGTPGFAAPECFLEGDETSAADVYGLAATTYAVLTGRPPYVGDDLQQVLDAQLGGPPPPPSALRDDLSPAVDAVLTTALASTPERRYRSASAFALALGTALARPSR